MPFYCGKRSAGVYVVLGQKNPQRIPANTPPVFLSLRPRICQQLLRLATEDYSDRLLVPAPSEFFSVRLKKPTLVRSRSALFAFNNETVGSDALQDAEKGRQRRSLRAQRLNVPKRTPRLFARCGLAERPF